MYSSFLTFLKNVNIVSEFIEIHKNLIPRSSIFEDYYIHTYPPNNVINKISTFEDITFSNFIKRLNDYDLNHCIIKIYTKITKTSESNETLNSFITDYTKFSKIILTYLDNSESITFTFHSEQNSTVKRINKFYTKNFIDLLNLINKINTNKT